MMTWQEYLTNSFVFQIFIVITLILFVNIFICLIIERKRISKGISKDDIKMRSVIAARRTWTGMLTGFVVLVTVGVSQFIIRFGYFSLLQEMGAFTLGLLGLLIGMVIGIKWPLGRE